MAWGFGLTRTRMAVMTKRVLIIAGPTASGKSSFALKVAEKYNGEIINADSLQVYKDIDIITSQPPAADKKRCPHHLYGVFSPDESCSAGLWRKLAVERIQKVLDHDKLAIVVGGTGLYLKTLTDGISPIPVIKDSIRQQARALFDVVGAEEYFELVKKRDAAAASSINPKDKQRMIRIMEVYEGTGKRLSEWHKQSGQSSEPWTYLNILILPPRDHVYERINKRFRDMVEEGVVDEVKNFLAKRYPQTSTAHKAVGLKEIAAYLDGKMTLDAAIDKACQLTRNYAKRQYTWFRGQFSPDILIEDPVKLQTFEI